MTSPADKARPPWSLLVIALVGGAAHLQLILGQGPSPWLLPIAALVAGLLQRPRPPDLGARINLGLVVLAAAAIAFGAVATTDRSWDGFTTWSLSARALLDGGLDQPYFADPTVYHFAREYPLLQPILLQQTTAWLGERGGRLLFPVLWVLWVMAVAAPLRELGVPRGPRALAIAGAALVPIFFDPGHGGADSGFCDLLVAILLTHGIAGVLLGRHGVVFCAALLLPWTKLEGTAYALALAAAAGLTQRPRLVGAAALGGTLGLSIWLPIHRWLAAPGTGPLQLTPELTAFAPLVVGVGALAVVFAVRVRRLRVPIATVVGLVAVTTPWWLPLDGLAGRGGAVRWDSLPRIAAGLGGDLLWLKKLGLTFPLLLVAAITAARRGCLRPAGLALAVVLGNLILVTGYLATRDPADLALFLKEGLVRYVAQSVGVAWLAIGVLLGQLATDPVPANR